MSDVRTIDNRIEYSMRQKDGWPSCVVASLVLDILEKHINIKMADVASKNRRVSFQITESEHTIGDPISILCE